MSEYTTFRELAVELGMDRSHLRRFALSLGIEPERIRTEDSGGQLTLAVNGEGAALIRESRLRKGFSTDSVPVPAKVSDWGSLYLVQLEPKHYPTRVKLGYANNYMERLSDYRVSNPHAQVACAWDCKRCWEKAAIAAITNHQSIEHVAGEVYDAADVEVARVRGDEFFAMLPHPG